MRRRIPSLTALQCFDASARHLSFTKAAEELALTQSAISRQIKKLEEFLACPLFERVKQRLQLTEIGRAYAKDIREVLDQAETATLRDQGSLRGTVLHRTTRSGGHWSA